MIPNELLKLIPKYFLNQTNGWLVDVLNRIVEDNLNKTKKAVEYDEKYGNQNSGLLTFLVNSGLFPNLSSSNNLASYLNNFNNAVNQMKKEALEIADKNLELNAEQKERTLYAIAKLLDFQSKIKFTNIKKIINETAGKSIFNEFNGNREKFVKDENGEIVLDDDGKPKKIKATNLNALVFMFLVSGESEVRAFLREKGYNLTLINSIIKNVIRQAEENKELYSQFVNPIKEQSKIIRSDRESMEKAQQIYQESLRRGKEILKDNFSAFSEFNNRKNSTKIFKKPNSRKK